MGSREGGGEGVWVTWEKAWNGVAVEDSGGAEQSEGRHGRKLNLASGLAVTLRLSLHLKLYHSLYLYMHVPFFSMVPATSSLSSCTGQCWPAKKKYECMYFKL